MAQLATQDKTHIIMCVIMEVVALLEGYNAYHRGQMRTWDRPGYPLHTIAYFLMCYSGMQQIGACANAMSIHWQTHTGSNESNEELKDDELLQISKDSYCSIPSHEPDRLSMRDGYIYRAVY